MISTLSVLAFAAAVSAHGFVPDLLVAGSAYKGFDPYRWAEDPDTTYGGQLIGWTIPDNGPVTDVSSAGIACNIDSVYGASTSAPIAAGEDVTFLWGTDVWPESHKGPEMTYLANCGGDCSTVDPTTLDFFKIDEAGYDSASASWASDTLIANNNSWTVTIPSDIAPGSYLIRHELLALHSASTASGAQWYPMCANLEISGSGSAVPSDTVKFPGAYDASDPGVLINIYYGSDLDNYVIPGPTVYGSGSTQASGSASSAIASSTAAASSAASSAVDSASSTVASEATSSAAPIDPVSVGTGTGYPFATGIPSGTASTGFGFPGSQPLSTVYETIAPEATSVSSSLGQDGTMTVSTSHAAETTVISTSTIMLTKTATAVETQYVTVYPSGSQSSVAAVASTVTVTVGGDGMASFIPECTYAPRKRSMW